MVASARVAVQRVTMVMLILAGVAMCASVASGDITTSRYMIWDDSISMDSKLAMMKEGTHNPYREFNQWVNTFVVPKSVTDMVTSQFNEEISHYVVTYIRNLVGGTMLYYIAGGLWHLYIYYVKGEECFTRRGRVMPNSETIADQILLSQASMFLYVTLPVFVEWMIENGYTRCFYYAEEVGGWKMYALYTAVYLFFVEIGVYWMHRELHEQKFLYKYVHALHHKYNRPETLSPWASVAFNPLDGILQASPYVYMLFFVPCHYLTHVVLLFFTAVWATNIHDSVDGNTEPIMGAKYHTRHHTHYHCNFGQFTIFADWLFGTLEDPVEMAKVKEAKARGSESNKLD